jgi:myo-inositol-1(or 4)-monophosphatase
MVNPESFTDKVLETADTAARRAGAIQMNHFRKDSICSSRRMNDVKEQIDRLCEEAIINTIQSSFPNHSIISEERGKLQGNGMYTWIIDPLDGTTNYWHGLPFFCVSIACYQSIASDSFLGLPIAGVVFLPYGNELFTGIPGRGAFFNKRRLHIKQKDETSNMVVSVSFGKTPEMRQRMLKKIDVLLSHVQKGRCLGAVAAEMAYVAAGYLDGMFYEGIHVWDFAAGRIILEESGGYVLAWLSESQTWQVQACAPQLATTTRTLLEE